MNKLTSALHDATHQVPGVPAHSENRPNEQPTSRRRGKRPHLQGADGHHQTPQRNQKPPRVLIGWQTWIGEHIRRNDR